MAHLKLKWKLALIGLLPFIAFFITAYLRIDNDRLNLHEVETTLSQMELVSLSSQAVHELQIERGKSASFLSGAPVLSEVKHQWQKADEKIRKIREYLPIAKFPADFKSEILLEIDKLPSIRNQVESQSIATSKAVQDYTDLVLRLLNVGVYVSSNTKLAKIATDLNSLSILEDAKEHGGKLRAVVSGTLAKNTPISSGMVHNIIGLQAGLHKNVTSKGLNLNQKEQQTINAFLDGSGWPTIKDTVLTVVKKSDEGNFGLDSSEFFKTISGELNKVSDVISFKRDEIAEKLLEIKSSNERSLISLISFLLATGCALCIGITLSIQRLTGQLNMISNSLSLGSDVLNQASKDILSRSQGLSQSAIQQAASLQQTITSADEISAMVSRNAQGAKDSLEKSEWSKNVAIDAQKSVKGMLSAIHDISSTNDEMVRQLDVSNSEISEIVKVIKEIDSKTKVINDIVFQTKLLSFNASVEAARAGEHGKGFAVVAEEIGSLAAMSGQAANQISSMLDASISQVEKIVGSTKDRVSTMSTESVEKVKIGLSTAEECSKALENILVGVNEVDNLLKEISEASHEQSLGLQEISKAVSELDQVSQMNSQGAQQTANIAKEIEIQSKSTDQIVRQLSILLKGARGAFRRSNHSGELQKNGSVHAISQQSSEVKSLKENSHPIKMVVGLNDSSNWTDDGFEDI